MNGATALTVGDNEFNFHKQGNGSNQSQMTPFNAQIGSHSRIVPELEAKIGGKYTYATPSGNLILDAGWLWINYFNGLHFAFHDHNFALNGPYVGLKYIGTV